MMATEEKNTTPGPAGNIVYCDHCRTAWCEDDNEFWWLYGYRGASWCEACATFWEPHARPPNDEAIQKLCGFDLVGALNRLQAWLHAFHPEPGDTEDARKRELAARAAYDRLYTALRSEAPERLADKVYADALQALCQSLTRFIDVATERDTRARRLAAIASERRSRLALLPLPGEPEPRPLRVSRIALGLAHSLARVARWLLENWRPTLINSEEDPRGLTLRLSKPKGGRQYLTLLSEVECELHRGGWTFREIGDLDFDDEKTDLEKTAREQARARQWDKLHLRDRLDEIRKQAEDRVRKRIESFRADRQLEPPSDEAEAASRADRVALRAEMDAARLALADKSGNNR